MLKILESILLTSIRGRLNDEFRYHEKRITKEIQFDQASY